MCIKPTAEQVALMTRYYDAIELARFNWKEIATQAKNQRSEVAITIWGQIITEHSQLDQWQSETPQCDCCKCPVHATPHKKMYTFGSSMSGETEVHTFKGCQCAIAERHGLIGSATTYHTSYNSASGVGVFHREMCKAKYR
jgi:hypothetical protein